MLQDVVNPPERHNCPGEALSSPIDHNQALDLGDDDESLPDQVLATSDNSCCSGERSGGGGEGSSEINIGTYDDVVATFSSPFSSFPSMDPSTLAALLDGPDPDPTFASIDYSCSLPPPQPAAAIPSSIPVASTASISGDPTDVVDPFDRIRRITDDDILNGYPTGGFYGDSVTPRGAAVAPPHVVQIPPTLPPAPLSQLEDHHHHMAASALSGAGYVGLDPMLPTSCSFVDPATTGMSMLFPGNVGLSAAGDGMFPGGGMPMGHGGMMSIPPNLGEYHSADCGEVGLLSAEANGLQGVYGSGEMRHIPGSCGSPTQLASEVSSSLDESTFKVGRLSAEERKEKIHRYIKKRNERNFSKKIKYACRKTLADSRPRVRGRFAKNDEFCETGRPGSSNHEDDDEEDVGMKDDIVDSSDIFMHLNSFKCNYTLELDIATQICRLPSV